MNRPDLYVKEDCPNCGAVRFVLGHLKFPFDLKFESTADVLANARAMAKFTELDADGNGFLEGAELENKARAAIGQALLSNPHSSVAFCNSFGLAANVDAGKLAVSKNGSWTDTGCGVVFEDEKIKAGVYVALSAQEGTLRYRFVTPFHIGPPPPGVWL